MLERLQFDGVEPGLLAILAGVLLLAFGRRLYWIFVGVAGFVVGYFLATEYLDLEGRGLVLVLAVAAGLLCAVLAVFFNKLAVGFVGFLAGFLALFWFADQLGWQPGWWILLVAILAGVLGSLLTRALFELGLIVFSSVAGASLVSQGAGWRDAHAAVLFLLLAFSGIFFQLFFARRKKSRKSD